MTLEERLAHYLERFFALQQYQGDANFNQRLARLRTCQATRLRSTHQALFLDPCLAPAMEFIIVDIYGGEKLLPVAKNIHRALPKAQKYLPQKVFETSATALEVALITQELDEAMVDNLGDQIDVDQPLSDAAYIAGYRKLGRPQQRQRQVELVAELGAQLERYLRSKLLIGAFKVAKKPAYKRGFEHLYDFMARCFDVMKPVPDTQVLLAGLAHRETVIMQQLFNGDPNPLALDRSTL